jgi:hypothetical protein
MLANAEFDRLRAFWLAYGDAAWRRSGRVPQTDRKCTAEPATAPETCAHIHRLSDSDRLGNYQPVHLGADQAPLPSDGLQQVVDGLSAAVADPNAMTQKMIGLAEAMLRNGPGGGTDGIILDYTAAKLALEVAEQPDSQKHGLSERVTMPDNGQDTYNVVITPGAPDGIGNGYAVLFKKEHGTFLSQVMGAVDNIVTPIVDVAAFFQPELTPLAIGLNVAQGAQQLAEGNVLGGVLDIGAAIAGGVGYVEGGAATTASEAGNKALAYADRGIAQIAAVSFP